MKEIQSLAASRYCMRFIIPVKHSNINGRYINHSALSSVPQSV